MLLTIVLRQEVEDQGEAQRKVDRVKEALKDVPDVQIAAQVNTKLEPAEPT